VPNKIRDILVVDDNPALLAVLSEILGEEGNTVRTASEGFSALAEIRSRVPDILLSDLNMPGMSGFELLSIVRRRFPAIAVIAMSGAYSGTSIPLGIAADAFYAKGGSCISHLFDILSALDDEESRYSARTAAPVWVQKPATRYAGAATVLVACPECLRPFLHPIQNAEPMQEEECCPHCSHPLQLAIVRHSQEVDRTNILFSRNLYGSGTDRTIAI
jgi:CheY-like chemotaxis protein